jgi:hypothetical protein
MTTVSNNRIYEDFTSHCAHPGCGCKVSTESEYCSAECEKQSDSDSCNCGHSGCQSEQKIPRE